MKIIPPTFPLPLLITGSAGVAGYSALKTFQARFPGMVVGILQKDNHKLSGAQIYPCDVDDRAGLKELFSRYKFKSVLSCGGSCALKACEMNPLQAWRVNVDGVRNILEQLESFSWGDSVRLLHLSCDLVFHDNCPRNGLKPSLFSCYSNYETVGHGYLETDIPKPHSIYGKSMLSAENEILRRRPDACILRISLPMGVSLNGHAGAVDWIVSRFIKNRPATLYVDEYRTPTYVTCLNRLYEMMLGNQISGLFHAGSRRRMSLFQVAQMVNRAGNFSPELLYGQLTRHASPIPPRARNVAMDSSKLIRTLGYNPFLPWPHDEHWIPTHPLWHYERPENERRGVEYLEEYLAE